MSDKLSHETLDKIEEFCRQVTVSYDLDEEIREELYGHIEDKVLGYLNGEEPLTEEDALVLVRERFGDTKAVNALLRETHGATLKRRLPVEDVMKSLLIVAASVILTYFFSDRFFVFAVRMAHVVELPLIYTGLMEPLIIKMKISLLIGGLVSLPVAASYLLLRMKPRLRELEGNRIMLSGAGASLCFAAGFAFSVFVVLPAVFDFVKAFIISGVSPMMTINDFITKILQISLLIGLGFEMPLIVFALTRLGVLDHIRLSHFRRYTLVGTFIFAAIVTPPDPISQIMLAIPFILLYEFSVIIARLSAKKQHIAMT